MIKFLQGFFNGQSLTYEQLQQAIESYNKANPDKALKVADLSSGGYVSTDKFNAKVKELETANNQITAFNQAVKDFEGDKAALNQKIKDMESDYKKQTKALKDDFAKENAQNQWFTKNPTKYTDLIKSQFDMSKVSVDEKGNVIGLEEQGTAILEKYAGLFDSASVITGTSPANPAGAVNNPKPTSEWSYDDFVKEQNNK